MLEPHDGPGRHSLQREMHCVHQEWRRELPHVLPQHLLVVPDHMRTRTRGMNTSNKSRKIRTTVLTNNTCYLQRQACAKRVPTRYQPDDLRKQPRRDRQIIRSRRRPRLNVHR